MKKIKLPYKLLTYDIETRLIDGVFFGLGEQVLRHHQLSARAIEQPRIICIAAKWYDKKEVMLFTGKHAIEQFDKEARKADVCLGKNSAKFDVKYINTERMVQGLKPYPEWMDTCDDLEVQLRRYFHFPSQSLDYLSQRFGAGGKVKMDFGDWKAIYNYELIMEFPSVYREKASQILCKTSYTTIKRAGERALNKMYFYNKKDVLDTEKILIKVLPYIKLKKKASASENGLACITCGSHNISPSKVITCGQTKYQQFECLEHIGYAGKATWRYIGKSHNKTYGKIS